MGSDEKEHAHPQDLAGTLAQVARLLLHEDDLTSVLNRIAVLAVATIDGVQHCGITIVEGEAVHTAGSSGEVPVRVDQIQYDTDQGPCLDAIRQHQVLESGDITAELERWPAFAPRVAAETGIRSVMSFRLYADERTMGALNLYSHEVDAYDEDDRHVASLFAAHAAVALANAREVANLQQALITRDIIATAKGMLMARSELTDEEAFDILRRASQRLNVKLRIVAQRLVDREPLHGSD